MKAVPQDIVMPTVREVPSSRLSHIVEDVYAALGFEDVFGRSLKNPGMVSDIP